MRRRRSSSSALSPSEIRRYLLDVGQQVRTRREQAGLTQAALAERAGLSERAVRLLESGHNATLRTCAQVALALGLYPEDLSCPAGLSGGVARVVLERMQIG